MALQKKLDFGHNDYHVPEKMPILPKFAKGKRSIRKKVEENRMCAFDLLASVARKVLLENESFSILTEVRPTNPSSNKGGVHDEQLDVARDKASKAEAFFYQESWIDMGNKASLQSKLFRSNGCEEEHYPVSDESLEGNLGSVTKMALQFDKRKVYEEMNRGPAPKTAFMEDMMEIDVKPLPFVSSDICDDVPICRDHAKGSGVEAYEVENTSVSTRTTPVKDCRIRMPVASRYWNVAPGAQKREAFSAEANQVCHGEKNSRTQRCTSKRRKILGRSSALTSEGRTSDQGNAASPCSSGQRQACEPDDLPVKLSIKSFRVPELFIDISESATVASLKRTVMDAVMAILEDGLRVGIIFQGKKVRDDNKTLFQVGIARSGEPDNLGFTLEPIAARTASPPVTLHNDPDFVLPLLAPEPLASFPAVAAVPLSSDSPVTTLTNCHESSDRASSVHTPSSSSTKAHKAESVVGGRGSRSIVSVLPSAVNVDESLAARHLRKSRRTGVVQRRIRRPFSVSEVEVLVQAVEKLGTGRWRDVKLRAFDNSKHRTYVDLKDKWKTLVHTAKISPQQRRGEPVPQELLDRVLSAHAYWAQQQDKLQVNPPSPQTLLLL